MLTETVSTELTIAGPAEIALYEKTFAMLAEQAAFNNNAARAVITAAPELNASL